MSHVPGGLVYKRLLNCVRKNGVFVCTNGPLWHLVDFPSNPTSWIVPGMKTVGYGFDRFIISANKSPGGIVYFSDSEGENWNYQTISGTANDMSWPVFTGSAILISFNAVQKIRSFDGVNYSLISCPGGTNQRQFVVDGKVFSFTSSSKFHVSADDGNSWSNLPLGFSLLYCTVPCDDGSELTAVRWDGVSSFSVLKSLDRGASWSLTPISWPVGSLIRANATDGNVIVGVGLSTAYNRAVYSTDKGLTWNLSNPFPNPVNGIGTDIIYANGKFLACASNYLIQSSDGVDWEIPPNGHPTHYMNSICANSINYVADLQTALNDSFTKIRVGKCA